MSADKDNAYEQPTLTKSELVAYISNDQPQLRGFGSMTLHYRPPRIGRNPKTGEKVQVPEKYVPHFKPGASLRKRVDEGFKESMK